MKMNPDSVASLWVTALTDHNLLGKISEQIIERVYRSWIRSGDKAIDIGANVGRHFFPMAECVGESGKLSGFEPIPSLGSAIRKKMELRRLGPNITLTSKAVSDAVGRSTFFEVTNAPALSGLRPRDDLKDEMSVCNFETEVTTVDEIVGSDIVRFIKVDVEGAEFNVFKGARQTLLKGRPVVAFEDGRGRSCAMYKYTMDDFHSFFESINYEVLDIFGFRRTREMEKHGGPWNYFAVPREIVSEVEPIIVYANMMEIWGELNAKLK